MRLAAGALRCRTSQMVVSWERAQKSWQSHFLLRFPGYTRPAKMDDNFQMTCLGVPLPKSMRALPRAPPVVMGNPKDTEAVSILRRFGESHRIPQAEIGRACDLASGPRDVVILLDRPAKNHLYNVTSEVFVKDSPTLKALDDMIRFATNGARSIHTVAVFDAHPFAPKGRVEDVNHRIRYPKYVDCEQTVRKMLLVKEPRVVICCWAPNLDTKSQDDTKSVLSEFVSSGVAKPLPAITSVFLNDGYILTRVHSFHPGTVLNHDVCSVDLRILLIHHFVIAFASLSPPVPELSAIRAIEKRLNEGGYRSVSILACVARRHLTLYKVWKGNERPASQE